MGPRPQRKRGEASAGLDAGQHQVAAGFLQPPEGLRLRVTGSVLPAEQRACEQRGSKPKRGLFAFLNVPPKKDFLCRFLKLLATVEA